MKLLISVAHCKEINAAVEGGADIIDIKNPAEGALGANFPHVIKAIKAKTPQDIPVSAAIGDVPNLPGMISLAALGAASCGVQYVKVGLYGVQNKPDAVVLLKSVARAVRDFDATVQLIATAYADAHRFNALPPMDLPDVAVSAGIDGCLIDTAIKGEGTLLTNLSEDQILTFTCQCRQNGLISALAGSLQQSDIEAVCTLGADIIGVRTAACRGDRVNGVVDASKVRHLKEQIGSVVCLSSALD